MGYAYDSEINESVTAIAGEFAANAVQHGHVPGRGFALRLTVAEAAGTLRLGVEVSDTRDERLPSADPAASAGGAAAVDPRGVLAEIGRGLLLVGCLASRWGVAPGPHGPGKPIWAEYAAATRRPGERYG